MSNKTSKDYAEDYTKPELRARLKESIKQSDKGGKPGQWSARKAQLLTKAYEKQGGDYKHKGKRTAPQKSLAQWTEEDWQTADKAIAIDAGKTKRYLPKEVWDQLSAAEKAKTNALKVAGSKQGRQYISNPAAVKKLLKQVHAKHHK